MPTLANRKTRTAAEAADLLIERNQAIVKGAGGDVEQSKRNRMSVQRTKSSIPGAIVRRDKAAHNIKKQAIITGGLKALSTVAKHRDAFLNRLGMHRK